jgi:hypothetical protein
MKISNAEVDRTRTKLELIAGLMTVPRRRSFPKTRLDNSPRPQRPSKARRGVSTSAGIMKGNKETRYGGFFHISSSPDSDLKAQGAKR